MGESGRGESDALRRIQALVGVEDEAAARRIVYAVMTVFFEQISPAERGKFVHVLPRDFRALVPHVHVPLRQADAVDDLYERVAAREGVELGSAVEHVHIVCRALAEVLDQDERRLFADRLPESLGPVLAVRENAPLGVHPEHGHVPPRTPLSPDERRTLAEGRPGSRHPLSESAPRGAQQDSVASTDNPHGDSKVSSTHRPR